MDHPPPRANLVSSFLIGAAIFTALLSAAISRAPHAAGPAPVAMAHQLYEDSVERETADRQDAARRFRNSPWSQDDDFHAKEMRRVRDFAKARNVSVSSLLDAIDDGMHQHWATHAKNPPNPKVMPCRPRLIY